MAEADPARAFFRGLTPPQREALDAAKQLLRGRRDDLGWHHDLGTRLAPLTEGGGYGARRVDQVAQALGLSRAGVYQHVQFVERYPNREEVVALGDSGLLWAMVVALLAVDDAAARSALEQAAIRQQWSVDRLRLEVRRLRPSPKRKQREARQPSRSEIRPELCRLDEITAAWLLAYRDLQAAGEPWVDLGHTQGEEGRLPRQRLEALVTALDHLQHDAVEVRWRLRDLLADDGRR